MSVEDGQRTHPRDGRDEAVADQHPQRRVHAVVVEVGRPGGCLVGVAEAQRAAALGVGVLGGAAAGALHHKSLGLTDADKARLTTELTAGKAAVGVLAHFDTAPAVSERLTQLGGASEAHELSDEALEAAAADTTAA